MDSLCHPWFTTTNLSYRFPIFETSATALCGTTDILLCRYVYTSLPCLDRISQWQQRLRYKLLFLLLVLSSVCVSSEQVTALRTWAIAYEKPHTTFTDEVLLHELHVYTHDTYSHCFLRLRTLPATSQRSWWLGLRRVSGAVSSTSAASRRVLCWRKCVLLCFFLPWSGWQAFFVACLWRGRFAISCFFLFVPRSFCFFLLFSSKKQVPMVTPQDCMAQGHKVGRHAVPRDPWPSWVAGHLGASGGSWPSSFLYVDCYF